MKHDRILILDFGSQYTQLIARRIREEQVYSEIHPPTRSLDWIREWSPKGIILSGGPASVYDEGVPTLDVELLHLGVPVLGICYGMQIIAQLEGSEVAVGRREYGRAELTVIEPEDLFHGFLPEEPMQVWCSHADHVDQPPEGYRALASTETLPVAAFRHGERPIFGVQFHPEVAHTPRGEEIISNFLIRICGCRPTWTAGAFIEESVERIRATVGDGTAICGLSGGVDSSVAAALVHRAIGDRLTGIFVDNGLLRKHEREDVERTFREHEEVRLVVVDAADEFLSALEGIEDPEEKRRAIGRVFIDVFSRVAEEEGTGDDRTQAGHLVQGTLYPDVIESLSTGGSVGDDQDPSQCRRASGRTPVRSHRAPSGTLQGRGPAGRPGARSTGGIHTPAPVPRSRAGHPGAWIGDQGATRRAPSGRRDLSRRDQGGGTIRRDLAGFRGPSPRPDGGGDGGTTAHTRT